VIVDLHSDLLLDVYDRRVAGERNVVVRRHLPVLGRAGVGVQVLAVYCSTQQVGEGALRHAIRLVDAAHRDADESDGAFRIVTNRRELDDAIAAGAFAGVLGLEGAEPLGRDTELIDAFWRLGVRVVGLTWNRANDVADGCGEDRGIGITPLGWQLLDDTAQRRMIVDVSHLTARATSQVLDRYPGAVMASHSNASAVYAHRRNLDDGLLARIGQRRGVVGLNFVPSFIGPDDPITGLAAHWQHIRRVAGADAVAVGADFVAFLPDGPAEPEALTARQPGAAASVERPEPDRETSYRRLAEVVADPDAVLGANALRFLRDALDDPVSASR
jgi:membrane dipeptidase